MKTKFALVSQMLESFYRSEIRVKLSICIILFGTSKVSCFEYTILVLVPSDTQSRLLCLIHFCCSIVKNLTYGGISVCFALQR